jgi:tetratricopeptide (TPR) repeat protein
MNRKERARIESQAERLIKRGKLQEAISEYRKILAGDDQDIPVRNIMGDLFVRLDQKQEAVAEFKKIADFYEEKGLFSKSIAILKRINRIDPDHLDSIVQLAQLYENQGFTSEAKSEYARLAKTLVKKKKSDDAVQVYEKLIQLAPQDMTARATLAEMYEKAGKQEQAVEEYNSVAEYKMRKNELKEARTFLETAKTLKEDYPRTLTNLIDLFKREDKKKEALDLVNEILKKDKDNVKALYLLGNLHFEDNNLQEAEEVFSRIISIRPKEVEARVKIGKIHIQNDELDQAFEIFDPLADTLIRKQKEKKAIGLLGLILTAKKAHLPTLEKLKQLYGDMDQPKSLKIILETLLAEYQKHNLREKMLSVLQELIELFPENEKYYQDLRSLKEELGISDEELGAEQASIRVDEAKEIIESSLAKADLYVEQGLVRNARRILENLLIRFPDEPRIAKKLEQVKSRAAKIKAKDIVGKLETVQKKETEFYDHLPVIDSKDTSPARRGGYDDRLTAADIFAETDLIPIITELEEKETQFYDLAQRISEEQEAIAAVFNYQMRGDTAHVEKALTDIVADFRRALDKKVDREDYDSHYNLGIAFMEQGLYDEAIEECQLAAKDKKLVIDSYSVISHCYRQKKDYKQAMRWLDEMEKLVEADSPQFYALQYEMACLYEDLKETSRAVELFRAIAKWDAEYRDVAEKLQSLESST